MTVYVSTGGVKNKSCIDTANNMLSSGINNIELSGGRYDSNLENGMKELLKRGAKLTLHNYVPFMEQPYILNLASENRDIIKASISHIRKAIDLSEEVESKFYAFHAGYLIDPDPSELGRTIKKRRISNRESAYQRFCEHVVNLASYASSKGVRLLVENNVLSGNNLKEFGGSPLLLCAPDEIDSFFYDVNNEVGLLLDLAHLKVSSTSLKFDCMEGFSKLKAISEGFHLSDNDGFSDSNSLITKDSWFMNLEVESTYKVIEVYNETMVNLASQVDLIEKNYDKNP